MRSSDINTAGIEEAPENVDFSEGDKVDILIYKFTDLGATVIINDEYFGLVYENDIYKEITVGDRMKGYIKKN
ncbi:hypothetical protein [Halanaerobium congolense]|jgi:hypothetical protein|uniref:S1 motif domain-containing protein n=1 Tax=Halanaerobium congolense TaxID=54121 RepID=A0A1G6NPR0_9FIRM|nr:hypothetical protein [Halanaerobium congolense]KXS48336.1 MAG: hypothetical protein AWL62_1998 [Halanaerobium sp. T82-1]PXV63462.1 hypothetical protein C8C78_1233 [Halanaerobium congolense]TDS29516.1 hypothetical protein BY453_1173 [Halanaerobium congolense]TDX43785.1 hypothetical protein C7954_11480 [Halanaerobium congolense]SDC69749.1 hypothetical protein SAMN04488597_1124 [Halanaerobium congolense]